MREITKLVATVTIAIASGAAVAEEGPRKLHDTYCVACHNSSYYTRSNRLAQDYQSLREQVNKWQNMVSLRWSQEQIDQMTSWLAEQYYGFPCPSDC